MNDEPETEANEPKDEDVQPDEDIIELPAEDAEKLKQFIRENSPSDEEKDSDKSEKKKTEDNQEDSEDFADIPREQLFDPYEDGMGDADELPAIDGIIEVTENDKQNYLRAILNDKPVVFTISLCGGEVEIKVRARTAWEQSLVYEAVFQDQEMKIVNEFRQGIIQLQKYSAALMIQSINGRLFSNEVFEKKTDSTWEKDIKRLRELVDEKIENMDGSKVTLILNALRIFEWKLARISTQCLTGNFWNPAD
jgi:hypothetical protein